MTRDELQQWLFDLMAEKFEIENLGLDDDLRTQHEFDSIDAIELLAAIEDHLGIQLTQDDKKSAMDIRTPRQILDYIEAIAARSQASGGGGGADRADA